jgi:hypothetical protein
MLIDMDTDPLTPPVIDRSPRTLLLQLCTAAALVQPGDQA